MMGTILDAVLDRSILFSFDRSGFLRHARNFRPGDSDVDLTGRVCVVTGANSGIGRAAATALAARGAEVWLLCRDRGRGEEAVASIRKATGNRRVHLEVVDVSHLAAVRAFVERFAPARVDVLIHNAGVLPATRQESPEGLELTLATNVIGPFLLTHLLQAKLAAATGARVIFVSPGGMYAQRLSLDDLKWMQRPFDGVTAYAQTKRMQVILTELLARGWARARIAVHAMHPGWADTPSVLDRQADWPHHPAVFLARAERGDPADRGGARRVARRAMGTDRRLDVRVRQLATGASHVGFEGHSDSELAAAGRKNA